MAFEVSLQGQGRQASHHQDKAFIWGSIIATFFQGGAGALIEGIPVVSQMNTPVAGWMVVCRSATRGLGDRGLRALGCTWLISENRRPAARNRHSTTGRPWQLPAGGDGRCQPVDAAGAHRRAARWFTLPESVLVPAGADSGAGDRCTQAVQGDCAQCLHAVLHFLLIFLGYSGLGISLWRNIIPPSISIWEAAAPRKPGLYAGGSPCSSYRLSQLHLLELLRVPLVKSPEDGYH